MAQIIIRNDSKFIFILTLFFIKADIGMYVTLKIKTDTYCMFHKIPHANIYNKLVKETDHIIAHCEKRLQGFGIVPVNRLSP